MKYVLVDVNQSMAKSFSSREAAEAYKKTFDTILNSVIVSKIGKLMSFGDIPEEEIREGMEEFGWDDNLWSDDSEIIELQE